MYGCSLWHALGGRRRKKEGSCKVNTVIYSFGYAGVEGTLVC